MHHLVEEGEVFGLKLARLTKHSGYGRIGVAGQEVFPDERGDRNAEVIGLSFGNDGGSSLPREPL